MYCYRKKKKTPKLVKNFIQLVFIWLWVSKDLTAGRKASPLLIRPHPRTAPTSGFITPASTCHAAPLLSREPVKGSRPQLMAVWRRVFYAVCVPTGTALQKPESKQAALIPRKLQWGEYKVLQGRFALIKAAWLTPLLLCSSGPFILLNRPHFMRTQTPSRAQFSTDKRTMQY